MSSRATGSASVDGCEKYAGCEEYDQPDRWRMTALFILFAPLHTLRTGEAGGTQTGVTPIVY